MAEPVVNVHAPAKVVAWGEYAVLLGAPAVVMALARTVRVSIQNASSNSSQITSQGPLIPAYFSSTKAYSRTVTGQMLETVLQHWGYNEYPEHWIINTDSSALFDDSGAKLGLGSSAATCVATYYALAHLLNKPATEEEAQAIHHAWQGKQGSGLDVAAAWLGGVIRFQNGAAEPFTWPRDWHYAVVWSGEAASTAQHLSSFREFAENYQGPVLDNLVSAAQKLTAKPDLELLAAYVDHLYRLDEIARLNIFTPAHMEIAKIAKKHDVLYKPCGAGGGDIGIAITDNAARLTGLISDLDAFEILPTEIATHGVEFCD